MTTDQYIKEFNKRVKIVEGRKWMLPIVSTSLSEQSRRLFHDGIYPNGHPIGTYSDSYMKLRQKRFGSSRKVILRFTNQLQSDFNNGLKVKSGIKKTDLGFATGVKNKHNGQTKFHSLADRVWSKNCGASPKKEETDFKKRMRRDHHKDIVMIENVIQTINTEIADLRSV